MSDQDQSERPGPWGPVPDQDAPAAREPLFNAPWPAVAIVAGIVALYGLQAWLAPGEAGIQACSP